MEERAVAFLRRLLDAPGPSGYETRPAQVWREEAGAFADDVTHDVVGNSYARVRPKGEATGVPTVILAGHIDEIGFVVTHIDNEGMLWFSPLGGWDEQVVVGQRLRILGQKGDVIGVIGKKAAHLLKEADRIKPTQLEDMWIDIGARDLADASERVEIGDAAVIDTRFTQLTDDSVLLGAWTIVSAPSSPWTAQIGSSSARYADVYAIATTQEEISFGGAYTASFAVRSDVAIAIDVTHATDYPGADKKRDHEVKLGGGPVLTRGATIQRHGLF